MDPYLNAVIKDTDRNRTYSDIAKKYLSLKDGKVGVNGDLENAQRELIEAYNVDTERLGTSGTLVDYGVKHSGLANATEVDKYAKLATAILPNGVLQGINNVMSYLTNGEVAYVSDETLGITQSFLNTYNAIGAVNAFDKINQGKGLTEEQKKETLFGDQLYSRQEDLNFKDEDRTFVGEMLDQLGGFADQALDPARGLIYGKKQGGKGALGLLMNDKGLEGQRRFHVKEKVQELLGMDGIEASPEELDYVEKYFDSWSTRLYGVFGMGSSLAGEMMYGPFRAGNALGAKGANLINQLFNRKIGKVVNKLIVNDTWTKGAGSKLFRVKEYMKFIGNPRNMNRRLKTIVTNNGVKREVILPSQAETMGTWLAHPMGLATGAAASYLSKLDPTADADKLVSHMSTMAVLGLVNVGFGYALGNALRGAAPMINAYSKQMLDPTLARAVGESLNKTGYAIGTIPAQPVGAVMSQLVTEGDINLTARDLVTETLFGFMFTANDAMHLHKARTTIKPEVDYRISNPRKQIVSQEAAEAQPTVLEPQIFQDSPVKTTEREVTAYEFMQNRVTEKGIKPEDMTVGDAIDVIAGDDITHYLKRIGKQDSPEARANIANMLQTIKETRGQTKIKGKELGLDEQGHEVFGQYDQSNNEMYLTDDKSRTSNRQYNNNENMISFLLHEPMHEMTASVYDGNIKFRSAIDTEIKSIRQLVLNDRQIAESILADSELRQTFEDAGLIGSAIDADVTPVQAKEFIAQLYDLSKPEFRKKLTQLKDPNVTETAMDKTVNLLKKFVGKNDPNNMYNRSVDIIQDHIVQDEVPTDLQIDTKELSKDDPLNMSVETLKSNEFKEFFGDWENKPEDASQMIDEQGLPRVFFHGTQSTDITQFNPDRSRGTGNWQGIYFTNNPSSAENYAKTNRNRIQKQSSPNVIPVYLDIKNPLYVSKKNKWLDKNNNQYDNTNLNVLSKSDFNLEQKQYFDAVDLIENNDIQSISNDKETLYWKNTKEKYTDNKNYHLQVFQKNRINSRFDDIVTSTSWKPENKEHKISNSIYLTKNNLINYVMEHYNPSPKKTDIFDKLAIPSYIKTKHVVHIKNKGFDGIIYNDGQEIVVFDPTQVKSAIGNKGTFDRTNPNILNMTVNTLKASPLLPNVLEWTPENYTGVTEALENYRTRAKELGQYIAADASPELLIKSAMDSYRTDIGQEPTVENLSIYLNMEANKLKSQVPMSIDEATSRLDMIKSIEQGTLINEAGDVIDADNLFGEDQYNADQITRQLGNIAKSMGYTDADIFKTEFQGLDNEQRYAKILEKVKETNANLPADSRIKDDDLIATASRAEISIRNLDEVKNIYVEIDGNGDLVSYDEMAGNRAVDNQQVSKYIGKMKNFLGFGKDYMSSMEDIGITGDAENVISDLFTGGKSVISSTVIDGKNGHGLTSRSIQDGTLAKQIIERGGFLLPRKSGGLVINMPSLHRLSKNRDDALMAAQNMQWSNFWKWIGSENTWNYDNKAKERMLLNKTLDPMSLYKRYVLGEEITNFELFKNQLSDDYGAEMKFLSENSDLINEIGLKQREYFQAVNEKEGLHYFKPIILADDGSSDYHLKALNSAVYDVLNWGMDGSGSNRALKVKGDEVTTGKLMSKYLSLLTNHTPLAIESIDQLARFVPDLLDNEGKINDDVLKDRKWKVKIDDEGEEYITQSMLNMNHEWFKDNPYLNARFKENASDGASPMVNKLALNSLRRVLGGTNKDPIVKTASNYFINGNNITHKSMFNDPQIDSYTKESETDGQYAEKMESFGKQVSAISFNTAYKNSKAYTPREVEVSEFGATLVLDAAMQPLHAYKTGDNIKKKKDGDLFQIIMNDIITKVNQGIAPSYLKFDLPITGKNGMAFMSTSHADTKLSAGAIGINGTPQLFTGSSFWKGKTGEKAYEGFKELSDNKRRSGIKKIQDLYNLYNMFNPSTKLTDDFRLSAGRGLKIMREDIARQEENGSDNLAYMTSIGARKALNIIDKSFNGDKIKMDDATLDKLVTIFDGTIAGQSLNEPGTNTRILYKIKDAFDDVAKLRTTGASLVYVPMWEGQSATQRLIDNELLLHKGSSESRQKLLQRLNRQKTELDQYYDPETGLAKDGSPLIYISRGEYNKLAKKARKNKMPMITLGSRVFATRTPIDGPDSQGAFLIAGILEGDGTIAFNSHTGAEVMGADFDKDGISLRVPDKDFTPEIFDAMWEHWNESGANSGTYKSSSKLLSDNETILNTGGWKVNQKYGLAEQERYTMPQHIEHYKSVTEADANVDGTIGLRNVIYQALDNLTPNMKNGKVNLKVKLNKDETADIVLNTTDRFATNEGVTHNELSTKMNYIVQKGVDAYNQRSFNPENALIDVLIESVDGVPYDKMEKSAKSAVRYALSTTLREIAGKPELRQVEDMKSIVRPAKMGITDVGNGDWSKLTNAFSNEMTKPTTNKQTTVKMQGGFENKGKGTPEGDGKDKAMREVANSFIGELTDSSPKSIREPKSSTATSALKFLATKETADAGAEPTVAGWADLYEEEYAGEYNEYPYVIMLARNKEFKNKPLASATKENIDAMHKESKNTKFIVGDMPGVDSPFIDYLKEIGADYTIYHTGDQSRIQPKAETIKGQTDIFPTSNENGATVRMINAIKKLHKSITKGFYDLSDVIGAEENKNLLGHNGQINMMNRLTGKIMVARVNREISSKGISTPYMNKLTGKAEDILEPFKRIRPFRRKDALARYAGSVYHTFFNKFQPKNVDAIWGNSKSGQDYIAYRNGELMNISYNKQGDRYKKASLPLKNLFNKDGTISVDWAQEAINPSSNETFIHELVEVDKAFSDLQKNEMMTKATANVAKYYTRDPEELGTIFTALAYHKFRGNKTAASDQRNSGMTGGTLLSPSRFINKDATKDFYSSLVGTKYGLPMDQARALADGEVAFNPFETVRYAKENGITPVIENTELSDHLIDVFDKDVKYDHQQKDLSTLNMSTFGLTKNVTLEDIGSTKQFLGNIRKTLDNKQMKELAGLANKPLHEVLLQDYQTLYDKVLVPAITKKFDKIKENKKSKRIWKNDVAFEEMKNNLLAYAAPEAIENIEQMMSQRTGGQFGTQFAKMMLLSNVADALGNISKTMNYGNFSSRMRNWTLLKSTIDNQIYKDLSNNMRVYDPEYQINKTGRFVNNEQIDVGAEQIMKPFDVIDNATLLQKPLDLIPVHEMELFLPLSDALHQKDVAFATLNGMEGEKLIGEITAPFTSKLHKAGKKFKQLVTDASKDIMIGTSEDNGILGLDPKYLEMFGTRSEYSKLRVGDQTIHRIGFESETQVSIDDDAKINEILTKPLTDDNNAHMIKPLATFLKAKAHLNTIANVQKSIAMTVEHMNHKLNTQTDHNSNVILDPNTNEPINVIKPERYAQLQRVIKNLHESANNMTNAGPKEVVDLMRKRQIGDKSTLEALEQIRDAQTKDSPEEQTRKYQKHQSTMTNKWQDFLMPTEEGDNPLLFNMLTQIYKTEEASTGDYRKAKDLVHNTAQKYISATEGNIDQWISDAGTEQNRLLMPGREDRLKKLKAEIDVTEDWSGNKIKEIKEDVEKNIGLNFGESTAYYRLLHDAGIKGFEIPFNRLLGDKKNQMSSLAERMINGQIDGFIDDMNQNKTIKHYKEMSSMPVIDGMDQRIATKDLTIDKLLLAFKPEMQRNNDYTYTVDNLTEKVRAEITKALMDVESVSMEHYNDNPDINVHARSIALHKLSRVHGSNNIYDIPHQPADMVNEHNKSLKGKSFPVDPGTPVLASVYNSNHELSNVSGRIIGMFDMTVRDKVNGTESAKPVYVIHDDSKGVINTIEAENLHSMTSGMPYSRIQKKIAKRIKNEYKASAEQVLSELQNGYSTTIDTRTSRGFMRKPFSGKEISYKAEEYQYTIQTDKVTKPDMNEMLAFHDGIGQVSEKAGGGLFRSINKLNNWTAKSATGVLYLGGQYVGLAGVGAAVLPFNPVAGAALIGIGGGGALKRWVKIIMQNAISNAAFGASIPTSKHAIGTGTGGIFTKYLHMLGSGILQQGIDFADTFKKDSKNRQSTGAAKVQGLQESTASNQLSELMISNEIKTNIKNLNIFRDMANVVKSKAAKKYYEAMDVNLRDINSKMSQGMEVASQTVVDALKYANRYTKKRGLGAWTINQKDIALEDVRGENVPGIAKTLKTEKALFIDGRSRKELNGMLTSFTDVMCDWLSGKGQAQKWEIVSAEGSYRKNAKKIEDIVDQRNLHIDRLKADLRETANTRDLDQAEIAFMNSQSKDMTPFIQAELEKSMVWKSIGNYIKTPSQSTPTGRLLGMFGNFSKESGLNQSVYALKRRQMHNAMMEFASKDKGFVNYMEHLGIPFGDWYAPKHSISRDLFQGSALMTARYGISGLAGSAIGLLSIEGYNGLISGIQSAIYQNSTLNDIIGTGDMVRMGMVMSLQSVIAFLTAGLEDADRITERETATKGSAFKKEVKKIIKPVDQILGGLGAGYGLNMLAGGFIETAILGMKRTYDEFAGVPNKRKEDLNDMILQRGLETGIDISSFITGPVGQQYNFIYRNTERALKKGNR